MLHKFEVILHVQYVTLCVSRGQLIEKYKNLPNLLCLHHVLWVTFDSRVLF